MNYLELINLTLQELNFKTVSDFSELVKPDYKKVATIVSRVNDNILHGNDWQFLMRELVLDVAPNATSAPFPFNMKIKNAYLDNLLLCYTSAIDNYFSNRFHAHQFTIFDGKVLFLPADKPRKLKLIYKTKNSAKTAAGEEIPLMTHGSDTTLMPVHHARSIVVFGACMEFKSDPSHPKYKHWRSLFTDAYAQMRSQSEFVADSYPKIKLPRWARGFDRC